MYRKVIIQSKRDFHFVRRQINSDIAVIYLDFLSEQLLYHFRAYGECFEYCNKETKNKKQIYFMCLHKLFFKTYTFGAIGGLVPGVLFVGLQNWTYPVPFSVKMFFFDYLS